MFLFKLVSSFVIPTVFTFFVIFVGFLTRKSKLGEILVVTGIFVFYISSITPTANFFINQLEKNYYPISDEIIESVDVVVLLLGGREADILRGSEVLRISNLSNHQKKIIISGTDPLNPEDETAISVRNFSIERGIPQEMVVAEGRSRNTRENARKFLRL